MILIWRANMGDFERLINSLHSPGASVLIGYVLIITGIIMMKIMLYDDGKYIVGSGVTLLVKSLTGTEKAQGENKDGDSNKPSA